jgi:hypothetical protein
MSLAHDLGSVYCGDLLKGRLFNVELYEVFRVFNGADSTVTDCFSKREITV